MKKIITIFALALLTSCSGYMMSYRDSMQGTWELVEVRDENGDMLRKYDVVEFSMKAEGDRLTVVARDASDKEAKATYIIKEDGRLLNTNDDRPNMYLLDVQGNKIVLVDRQMNEQGLERILVFRKAAE